MRLLTEQVKAGIAGHAEGSPGREVCGLLVLSGAGLSVFPCRNSAPSDRRFEIPPEDYLAASLGGRIVACYHSHVSDKESPSTLDVQCSSVQNLPFILYNLPKDSFCVVEGGWLAKYLGREFSIGRSDCFSLVRDFYRERLGIAISDYPRDERWYLDNPRVFLDNFAREGFGEVARPTKYSVLLVKEDDRLAAPHHLAIFMGDETILHHPRRKLSRVEPFSAAWKRSVSLVVEHREARKWNT